MQQWDSAFSHKILSSNVIEIVIILNHAAWIVNVLAKRLDPFDPQGQKTVETFLLLFAMVASYFVAAALSKPLSCRPEKLAHKQTRHKNTPTRGFGALFSSCTENTPCTGNRTYTFLLFQNSLRINKKVGVNQHLSHAGQTILALFCTTACSMGSQTQSL